MARCPHCKKVIYNKCGNDILRVVKMHHSIRGGDLRRRLVRDYGYTDAGIHKALRELLAEGEIKREKISGREFSYGLTDDRDFSSLNEIEG